MNYNRQKRDESAENVLIDADTIRSFLFTEGIRRLPEIHKAEK